jgi:hypothetical protein
MVGNGSQQQFGVIQQSQQLVGGSQQQRQQSATPAPTQQVSQGSNSQVKGFTENENLMKHAFSKIM